MRIVTAAVVQRDGLILVMRRAPGRSNAGYWEFPGGKLEEGETEQACLEREMMEETGVAGRTGEAICQSVYRYAGGEITLKAYAFTIERGEIALRVHDALRWVSPEELPSLALTPADVPVARAVAGREGQK